MDPLSIEPALQMLRKNGVATFSCPDFQVTFLPSFPSYPAPAYPEGNDALTTPFDDDPTPPSVDPIEEEARMMRTRQANLAAAYGMGDET